MNGLPFTLPNSSAMHSSMAQALALVRSGELKAASELLMAGLQDTAERSEAAHVVAPQDFGARLQKRAARFAPSDIDDVPDAFAKAKANPNPNPNPNPSAGAAPGARAPGRFERVAFRHAGAAHDFHLYVPASAAPASGRPLVLMLHGCTQEAQDFARGTRMNVEAESIGALVLYPTQPRAANQNGCWNWFRAEDQHASAGEPALLLAMVQQVMATHNVDKRRVYVAGLSAGGAMAALMAREFPQVFAAAGVHSGLAAGAAQNMMGALSAMKTGAKGYQGGAQSAVPLIVFHGDRDAAVHPRNGEQVLSAAARGGRPQTEAGKSRDGQSYTRTVVHSSSNGAVQAEHWLLHGAGHAWSGGDARGSHTSAAGVNASHEMLRFFMEHPQEKDRADDPAGDRAA